MIYTKIAEPRTRQSFIIGTHFKELLTKIEVNNILQITDFTKSIIRSLGFYSYNIFVVKEFS